MAGYTYTKRMISIPAPARGATYYGFAYLQGVYYISIPAPARGATMREVVILYIPLAFQFPPLREGRPTWRVVRHPFFYFNSRPCARGDVIADEFRDVFLISIPAPARGATGNVMDIVNYYGISIPAPARGATANLNKSVLRNLCEQANSKDACLLFYDM